jgi:hypothetical protein
MGKRGPKPSAEAERLEHVGVKMPPAVKQRLVRAVMKRKAADPSLPIRWGLSDYIREIVIEHLDAQSDE